MGLKKEDALPGAIVSINNSKIIYYDRFANLKFIAEVGEKLEIIEFYKVD